MEPEAEVKNQTVSDWTWPEDDGFIVNCKTYWISAFHRRGLSNELMAARRVTDWERRRSAPISYLFKYGDGAVAERVYYRLARALDLPQQHVFWGLVAEGADRIGDTVVAIKFEREAVYPKSIRLETGEALYRGHRLPADNLMDSARHWVMHVFCHSRDGSNQVMVRGNTLFGIDAAECAFEALSAENWSEWLAKSVETKPDVVQAVIYPWLNRLATTDDLPALARDELLSAPYWPRLRDWAYTIEKNLHNTQANLRVALKHANRLVS